MKKPRLSILDRRNPSFRRLHPGLLPWQKRQSRQRRAVRSRRHADVSRPRAPCPEPTTPETVAVTFPIDINRADAEQLTALPGVGEVLAQPHRRLPGGKRQLSFHRGAYRTWRASEKSAWKPYLTLSQLEDENENFSGGRRSPSGKGHSLQFAERGLRGHHRQRRSGSRARPCRLSTRTWWCWT